jgi:hypothetical protein
VDNSVENSPPFAADAHPVGILSAPACFGHFKKLNQIKGFSGRLSIRLSDVSKYIGSA